MTKNILNNSPFVLAILVALIVGTSSCKTKKNLAQVTPVEDVEPIEDEIVEELEEIPEAVEVRVPEKIVSKEQKLNNYFKAVSGASSTEAANKSINEALTMFNNPDAPLLIVIYNDGANPDYDEPTTIGKYLNYLKDTKSKPAAVEEVVYDSNGRIKELVLKK
ncbi:hypothetical protein SAMN04488029_0100 [Reichenbachiella faecimaris]|uniref:Nucleoid-structuring protein H-NS n=1 Tax=Reichenbachiella faecimaris TaxID=692418 RepID=A0A1W2G584_REIFA|nr:hypothetical protein [Reichenbachiella faecimaris]SMD31763.1 hypothetical protein SAMN04488029_0100 [Reichenbachiella faecimaris]